MSGGKDDVESGSDSRSPNNGLDSGRPSSGPLRQNTTAIVSANEMLAETECQLSKRATCFFDAETYHIRTGIYLALQVFESRGRIHVRMNVGGIVVICTFYSLGATAVETAT